MDETLIRCLNDSPFIRRREPVRLGVPFARGNVTSESELKLLDSKGDSLPLQSLPLTRWPDGSIKWLLCDFIADLLQPGETVFRLQQNKGHIPQGSPFRFQRKAECWLVSTGLAAFEIDTSILRPFLSVQLGESSSAARGAEVYVTDMDGQRWTPVIERLVLEADGPVRATLFFSGGFRHHKREILRFEARLHFFAASARAALEIRLHNARRARHPGNMWDLGDPASVMLREWTFRLPLLDKDNLRLLLRTDQVNGWHQLDPHSGGRLYQESSGGEHWDSPVHRNREGHVPMKFRGWRLSSDEQLLAEGFRAQPQLWWGEADGVGVSASIDSFWQRFPKALSVNKGELLMSLLPPEFPGGHELQGGEQVTETLRFDFAAPSTLRGWGDPPVDVRCSPEAYHTSCVFLEGLWQPQDPRYAAIARAALEPETGFHAKRERLDEYGWRNYGDVYADHETAFHGEDRICVSHYNNQYDLLSSFYRLYIAGCDVQWGALARALAAHVADIDIYHTDEDREEYCRGLFWHTDHYLDAGLSTHRAVSREHLDRKPAEYCGGGPAAEHCYSSGLTLHYFLTGDPRSRRLVLTIADWCWRSLSGAKTVTAAMLRTIRSFSRWRRDRGSNRIWPRYPLSRGTGNCLNATLDAFEITNDRSLLLRAAKLIQGTVHPEDRPEDRDLLNAEDNWSYTVFLAAVGRFLRLKLEREQLDGDYYHARASLLVFARWMAENEYPFLEKPEILEYPNETWAAQDLRKGVVLLYAAGHVPLIERPRFLERGRFFLDSGLNELMQHSTRHYTRPLALVLQNGWAIEAITAEYLLQDGSEPPIVNAFSRKTPRMTLGELMRRSAVDFFTVLPSTGPLQEWKWLRSRLAIR